tara:strand:- start:233 stop:802 length:570 start_codon:yes stop_codon:yes gene_type:complete
MASKKGKPTKLRIRKGKKRWFPVKFKGKDLAQITAYEPKEIVGRNILINMKEITGSARDSSLRLKLSIEKVQGDTATAESVGLFSSESNIGRASRKMSTRITSVFYANDKDDKKIKFKILLLSREDITRALQHQLRVLAEDHITKAVKKMSSSDVFTVETTRNLSATIKRDLKQVYPINDVIIWKVGLV